MQIQYSPASPASSQGLLFALNLVTLLMQIQYESSKGLIMNAL